MKRQKRWRKRVKNILFVQSKGSSRNQEDHKSTKRVKNIGNRNCTDVNNNVNSFHVLNYLNCFYTNADQFRNKFKEFQTRIIYYEPKIIGITEVKPKKSAHKLNPAEFSIDSEGNYNQFSVNIENDIGRGMILYGHKSLNAKEVIMDTKYEEYILVKVKLNNQDNLLVGLIYRSPSGSGESENNANLLKLINEATGRKFSHLLMMGDFNLPNID